MLIIHRLFKEFYRSEKTAGLILIICTVISLVLANSSAQHEYIHFWKISLGGMSLEHWINDALMTIFFLLIGLELEREIYCGELSTLKNALLPMAAALGGMCFPAAIYWLFNYETPTLSGTGIPTATDIAFALAILSLLGNRVPPTLKIFLTALAVVDDLGAIIIISLFYTQSLIASYLFIALGIFVVLLILNRLRVYSLIPYLVGGIAMWYFMHHSGVHATITGVLLAFAIPFNRNGERSPSYILQHAIHYPVAFIILPLFALANTAIPVNCEISAIVREPHSLGISMGLIIGKPIGITVFSYIAVSLGACCLPRLVNWYHIIGIGLLGGIGFTMSIFITLLAFNDPDIINQAKLSILLASCGAALIGFTVLHLTLKRLYIR
ncbi:MAG: Na+/H+ antiporter NhaA [Bacteroidales bacterium]|jgi:NhaA family Na+:H+ antiporter|nr:Na+/H+ antiporter NhaA [Bacteroidales bacterium]